MSQTPKKRDSAGEETSSAPLLIKRPRQESDELSSQPSDRPIDISNQIRTTTLCLNRIFQEQGLTHLILEFYQGVIMIDVINQMQANCMVLVRSTEITHLTETLTQQVLNYVQYYSECPLFVYMTLKILSANMEAVEVDDNSVRQKLAAALFDLLVRATREQTRELGPTFVIFVFNLIDAPKPNLEFENIGHTEWNIRFFEKLLQPEASDLFLDMVHNRNEYFVHEGEDDVNGELYVLSAIRDIFCAFSIYLHGNLEHPRRQLLLPKLDAAIHLLAGIVGEDEAVSDNDDDTNDSLGGDSRSGDEED
jgi:hypothetical protein